MDNQDALIQPQMANKASWQQSGEGSEFSLPGTGESVRNIVSHETEYKSDHQQKEIFDEEAAFSFRKKRTPIKARSTIPNPSPFLKADSQSTSSSPRLMSPPRRPMSNVFDTPKSLEPSAESSPVSREQAPSVDMGYKADDKEDTLEWELVWKGSWIVPSLEPIKPSSTSAASRRTPASLKKASLDNRQQAIFQSSDGQKLQSNVTELPGIALAISKYRQCLQDDQVSEATIEERQFMRENTEMHMVAKIRLSSFPLFLLMPGCTEPCKIFTSPESKTSADFLKELFDHDDIDEMKARCQAGDGTAIGQIALLLRVASKPVQSSKKKSQAPIVQKQDDNPFLQTTTRQSNLSKQMSEEHNDPRRKLYQDTSMFLVYGMLTENNDSVNDPSMDVSHTKRTIYKELPTISFFAYPLVDQTNFSEQMLLNTRSYEQLRQEAEDSRLSDLLQSEDVSKSYVRYEDPDVDSIMNGSNVEQEYEQGSNQSIFAAVELDEDKSLYQEMEILRALERSKTWSPYTVLPTPTDSCIIPSSKDIPKDRMLSRSLTLDGLATTTKDISARSILSRHKSMDTQGRNKQPVDIKSNTQVTSDSSHSSTSSILKASRKGISRVKSPSRAPQQPLDVTTESLRRKLLGPSSVRGSLPSISGTSSSSSAKSIEASNKSTVKGLTVSVLSKINIPKDHADFKECASNLYRSVTFAMRKDIASRRYNLEEVERLMDRHAALL